MTPDTIVIHHSASPQSTTVEQINEWHKARNFTFSSRGFYVGYHFVILATGQVIQTRAVTELGCHTIPNNGKIGICVIGDFRFYQVLPAQMSALSDLVDQLKRDYSLNRVKGHCDYNKTECPGINLYKFMLLHEISWLQKLLNILLKKPDTHV